jgi:hypothetical protein
MYFENMVYIAYSSILFQTCHTGGFKFQIGNCFKEDYVGHLKQWSKFSKVT